MLHVFSFVTKIMPNKIHFFFIVSNLVITRFRFENIQVILSYLVLIISFSH